MRRILPLALLLVLAACVPALAPQAERDGDTVTFTIAPTADLYNVTLSVLGATTSDERCVVLEGVDLGCVLGDIPAGETTTVVVTGSEVRCRAFAHLSPTLALNTYRTFPCS